MDALAFEREVAVRMIRRVGHHHEMRARRGIVERHRVRARTQRNIVVARVHVARDDEQRPLGTQRHRGRDSAPRLERLGLARPADAHAMARSIADRVHEHVGKMRRVDHDLAIARADERFDLPHDERLPAHHEQRLRRRVRQGPHAIAAAGGQDHRNRHQKVYPACVARPSSASSRTISGASSR
jgi:hypothetical protein